jgi:hypothetical protein
MKSIFLANDEKQFITEKVLAISNSVSITNLELLRHHGAIYSILSKNTRLVDLYSELITSGDVIFSIKNLPYDAIKLGFTESIIIGLTKFLGDVFQYKEQNENRLNAHLTPKINFLGKNNTGEGNGKFGWHTDDSIFSKKYRADWIQLFCLNNDSCTVTRYAKLDNILENLTEEDISILLDDRFLFGIPLSFNSKEKIFSHPKSILTKVNNIYEISYSEYNCFALNKKDKEAILVIHKICKIANRVAEEIVLSKGQVIVFDNNKGIHSRSLIKGNRSLYRTYIKNNLESFENKLSTDNTVSYSKVKLS